MPPKPVAAAKAAVKPAAKSAGAGLGTIAKEAAAMGGVGPWQHCVQRVQVRAIRPRPDPVNRCASQAAKGGAAKGGATKGGLASKVGAAAKGGAAKGKAAVDPKVWRERASAAAMRGAETVSCLRSQVAEEMKRKAEEEAAARAAAEAAAEEARKIEAAKRNGKIEVRCKP